MTVRIRIPPSFTLLGREWRVERPDLPDAEDKDCLGLANGRERLVRVTSQLDGEPALEVFAHEFTHAGLWRAGLSASMDERMAQAMEHVLIDFVKAVVEET